MNACYMPNDSQTQPQLNQQVTQGLTCYIPTFVFKLRSGHYCKARPELQPGPCLGPRALSPEPQLLKLIFMENR